MVIMTITSLWEIGGMGQNSWSKYLLFGKCLRYTVDVDVVFTKKNSSLSTLERGQWIRMLCDSSNLHKQKLVKPKPLASKMAAVKSGTKKWRSRTSGWVSILWYGYVGHGFCTGSCLFHLYLVFSHLSICVKIWDRENLQAFSFLEKPKKPIWKHTSVCKREWWML